MARSIKSKRGMALRRIKRTRYAKKELFRLNKMLGLPNKEDKPEEDVEMTTEADEKRGLTSKDYRLLKNIVKDGSDSEDSDVGKALEEVMVMTSSKFLRRKCQAMRHNENKRQLAKSNADAETAADDKTETNGDTYVSETSVHENEKLKRKHDAATLVNDFGSYPKWMNQKKIQALAKVNRSMKLKRNKWLAQKRGRRPMKLKSGLVSDDDSGDDNNTASEENVTAKNVTASEGLEMETDDVTTETTGESAKAKGNNGKKVAAAEKEAVKTPRGRRGRKGKKKETTEDAGNLSNTENTIETVDLSD